MVTSHPTSRPQTEDEALRILVEAGAILASSLELETTLQNVTRILVPDFCDGCVIDLDEHGSLVPIAVAHADPAKEALLREMRQRFPLMIGSAHPGAIAFQGAEPALLGETTEEVVASIAQSDDHARMLGEIDVQSVLAFPLMARDQIIGVLTMNDGPSGRRFHEEDIAFLRDLAQRIAVAVDNARLYQEAQSAKGHLIAALESVTDPFYIVDREWRSVFMNSAGAESTLREYGKEKEEVIGQVIWDIYPSLVGTEFYKECLRAQAERVPAHFEFQSEVTRNWYEVSLFPSADGLALFTRDITDRKIQEQIIRQLSVPVLEIEEGLLLMPIIGDLTIERAQLMADHLTKMIRAARARAAVMDITGLVTMDSMVAQYIISTAQAARLLGAPVVLTGVSSDMARTLVELGIRLTELSTQGSLRDGIEEARLLLRSRQHTGPPRPPSPPQ